MSTTEQSVRLPAEWEPQSGAMLTWPHDKSDWAPVLSTIEPVFARIAVEISRRENVLINCIDPTQAEYLRAHLIQAGAAAAHLFFAVVPSDDTWARDYAPLTVLTDHVPCLLNFSFNGWGGKYPAELDDVLSSSLHKLGVFTGVRFASETFILEGGSIESDGQGTILTTASCLLATNRNSSCSQMQIEQTLATRLGNQRTLWLQHGQLEGDDTDGHIDMLARFCDTETIAYQSCDEPAYRFFDELKAMENELQQFKTLSGNPYNLIPLPWPAAKRDARGQRLPASYANFFIFNNAVLLPGYQDQADQLAVNQLQRCFPDHEIILIPSLPLIQQAGSLHCLTMQFPEGVCFETNV